MNFDITVVPKNGFQNQTFSTKFTDLVGKMFGKERKKRNSTLMGLRNFHIGPKYKAYCIYPLKYIAIMNNV